MIYLTLFNSNDEYLSNVSNLNSLNVSYDNKKTHYLSKIKYTTSDNNITELLDIKSLLGIDYDVSPILNTYSGETGIMAFDIVLTTLGAISNSSLTEIYHAFPIFASNETLVSIEIPDMVSSILYGSFSNCEKLTGVTIPNSITNIGIQAFLACTSLSSITIPDSVVTIDRECFSNCSALTSITIPNSVTTLGKNVFRNCSNLSEINIGSGLTTISNDTFANCSSLTSITIPDSVTSLESEVFYSCSSLKTVTLGSGLTQIGEWCFSHCTNLATINYNGTTSDWPKITLGDGWSYQISATKVICTNGEVSL